MPHDDHFMGGGAQDGLDFRASVGGVHVARVFGIGICGGGGGREAGGELDFDEDGVGGGPEVCRFSFDG